MNHKTRLIKHGDMEAEVDLKIADLILNLWKLELMTTNSCEDNNPKDWIFIEFASTSDAEQFLNICANEFSKDYNSLYYKIRHQYHLAKDPWKYQVIIRDENICVSADENDEYLIETVIGKPDMIFSMLIRFPQSDLKEVERLVSNKLNETIWLARYLHLIMVLKLFMLE
jgi:hypothetical protein